MHSTPEFTHISTEFFNYKIFHFEIASFHTVLHSHLPTHTYTQINFIVFQGHTLTLSTVIESYLHRFCTLPVIIVL